MRATRRVRSSAVWCSVLQPNGYYQRLNALLDNPDALAYSPMLVNRL
ncbi:DUF3263 domain-containing protein [Cellulomonas sp. ICMP 17802]